MPLFFPVKLYLWNEIEAEWVRGREKGGEDLPWTELEVERHPVDRASADLGMSAAKDATSEWSCLEWEWLGPDLRRVWPWVSNSQLGH